MLDSCLCPCLLLKMSASTTLVEKSFTQMLILESICKLVLPLLDRTEVRVSTYDTLLENKFSLIQYYLTLVFP
jgi:hypothetical protein